MSIAKTWLRANQRSKERRKSGYRKFLKKIATGIAGIGFLATSNFVFGSEIVALDGATTVNEVSSGKFDIDSNKVVGANAFNAFSKFNLSTGHNANLHLPDGTENLINFVKDKIEVHGTLNAIKDNKIGGNVFFLSSQGLVVGSGGVVNCGSFFAITPTEGFMDNFVSGSSLIVEGKTNEISMITDRKFVNHNQVVAADGIPINNDATITINGQINAINNVGLTASQVFSNSGSQIKTGITDFAGLVNISNLPTGCQTNGLTMTSTDDGNIELVAIGDNKSALSGVSAFVADELTSFTKAEGNAKVYVNGNIEADRDAIFEAVAVNGELNDIDENFHEYGETKTLEKYSSTKFVSKINAEVEFGSSANIDANRHLVVNAIARNFYSPSALNLLDLGLDVLGMTSPINLGAEVVVEDSKAEILVNSGAILHASEDVKITADSKADVSVGASTALAKVKKTGGGISVGAVYADVNTEANVTINGTVTAGETGITDKGNIDVKAISVNNLDVTGATKTANDDAYVALATVVAKGSNNAKVTIDSDSTLYAENDVSISAKAINDLNAEAVAQTGNSSLFGVAVNVTDFESDADVIVNSDIKTNNGDINLEAENRFLQYRSVAATTIGYTAIAQATANAQSNLVSNLFSQSNFTGKFTDNLGSSEGGKFNAAGAIHFTKGKNNSKVSIGGDVKINAENEVNIAANSIVEDYFIQTDSKAVSKIDNPEGGKSSASAAVMSVDLEQRALIDISDSTRTLDISNAAITGKKVTLSTLTKVEYNRIARMLQSVNDAWATLQGNVSGDTWTGYLADFKTKWDIVADRFAALGSDEVTGEENIKVFFDAISALPAIPSEIINLIMGGTAVVSSAAQVVTNASDLLFYQNYLNMYVSSAVKGENGDNASSFGLAGAFAFNDFKAVSDILIGRNAVIETTAPNSDTSIFINGKTDIENISAAGHLLPSTAASSFGGTFLSQDFFSTAEVYVAEGASLFTNGKDIEIISNNKLSTTAIGVSSAIAKAGIEGMVSRQEGQSTSKVFIDDEAIVNAKNATFRATDATDILNIGGALMVNSGVGAGVGMAITDFTKENVVKISDIDKAFQNRRDDLYGDDPDSTANSRMDRNDGKITASEKINVEAKSTGDATSVGVAGGVAKNDDSGEQGMVGRLTEKLGGVVDKVKDTIDSVGDKFGNKIADTNSKTDSVGDDSGSHANPDFSLTAAGSLGINFIKNTTKVYIDGATLELGSVADSNFNATAINSSENKAWAGAAGIMFQTAKLASSQTSKTVGIAGAIGINSIENNTEALVENATINHADKINVFAVDGGQDLAMGLGLQLALNNGNAAGAYSIGSSVSVTNVDNIVTAEMKNNKVNGSVGEKTDLNVAAYEGDRTISGGAVVSVGKEKGAFGAAVNVVAINNTTTAKIKSGVYNNIGNVTVSSMQALTQINGALTAGIIFGTPDTCAIMGAMIYNQTDNIARAKIENADFTTDGNVAVNSRDYKKGDSAVSDFDALLGPVDEDVELFISTSGEDYYNIDTSNDVDGSNDALADQEIEGSLIVSGAITGTVADTPLGASIVINDLSNDFKSEIVNCEISANEIDANASVNSKLISVAAGLAVSLDNGGGAGSFVVNDMNNVVDAGFLSSDLTGAQVRSQARNGANFTSISGIISAGAGKASVGLASAYNNITNDTNAYSLATNITGTDSNTSKLLVAATNDSELLNIAASFGISEKVGIGGSISVNEITDNTISKVHNSYKDEDDNEISISGMTLSDLNKVNIDAEDKARLTSLAGNVAGGGVCGLGGSLSHSKIDGETSSYLKNATVSSAYITADASNESVVHSWAAGIGGGGKLAAQGAVANSILDRKVKTQLDDVVINNSLTRLHMNSYSHGFSNTNAIVANGAGSAAIGAGIAVNRITDEIRSEIHDSNLNIYDLHLKSISEQTIGATGVAGSFGGSAGVSGSVGYNRIRTENKAFVKDSTINANNNLGVVAQTDDLLLNYGGQVAIGGTAGVGAAFSGNTIEGSTNARIVDSSISAKGLSGKVNTYSEVEDGSMNDAFIDDQTTNLDYELSDQRKSNGKAGIVVDSSATHTLKSFVANAAGGGAVGLAGTLGVNSIEGYTTSYIKDSSINSGANSSDVSVSASDYTNYSSYVGSVGGAGTFGIGMAVNTNKTDRGTSARLENISAGSKAKALKVSATGKQGISSIAAGIGVAGTAGIAGTVSTTDFSGKTESKINNAQISVDRLEVSSDQFARSKVNNSTAGIGYVGVGGSVAVGTDKHHVSSEVTDSSISMNLNGAGDAFVKAYNYTDFNTIAGGVGAGAIGAAGNVAVNYLENKVTSEVNSSSIGSSDVRALNIEVEAKNDLHLTSDIGTVGAGAVGAGCSVGVNSIDGKVRAQVDGSSLYAQNDILVSADENRNVDQTSFTVAAGGGAASLNVMHLTSGELLSTSNDDGNKEILDAIDSAEEVNDNTVEDDNDVMTADEQAKMNGVGGDLSSSETGKSATTAAVGDIFTGNSSTLDSANGKVEITASEDTTTNMTGGAVSAGMVAAGGSIATSKVHRNLGVTVHDASICAGDDINISAEVTGEADLEMYQGSVGAFLSGTAAFGKIGTTGNAFTAVSDASLTSSGDINIDAADNSSADARSYGLTAGTISAGFINTGIDNSGSMQINLSNNQMSAEQDIAVKATKDNEISAKSVGGAVGIFGAGIGVHSYIDDSSDSAITMTGTNSSLNAQSISFTAENTPEIDSEATTVALSFLSSAGVSVATANLEGKATLTVADGNSFNAPEVNFLGDYDGDSDTKVLGVSGGFAASFGYNRSESTNKATVNVFVGNNDYLTTTDLVVTGQNIVNQSADTRGLSMAGIISSCNNKSKLTSETETIVKLSGDAAAYQDLNSLEINADSSSIHKLDADGNGGGLVSVDGLSAYAISDITSITEAYISGKWNVGDSVGLFATHYDRVKISADSSKGSIVGYSGTKAENITDSSTKAVFEDDTDIVSGSDVDFAAINTIGCNNHVNDPRYAASGAGVGGITVNGAKGIADITSHTLAKIGRDVNISSDGNITGNAKTDAVINNRVRTTGAGLVANPFATNETTINIDNNALTSSGSKLQTTTAKKDISIAASEQLDITAIADSDMQGGLGGYANASTDFDAEKGNSVKIYGDLFSKHDINLRADANSNGRINVYELEATAYAYNKHSAVAIANADLDSETDQKNQVIIGSEADVQSVRHIHLGATAGREKMTEETGEYTWESNETTGGYSSTSSGQRSKNVTGTNKIEINGDLLAGSQNKVHMTLDGIVDIDGKAENSSLQPTVTSTIQEYSDQLILGSQDYANALFERYQEVSDLAAEYKGTDSGVGYQAEKERLLNEMERYGLYDRDNDILSSGLIIQYIELPSMVSSGGNVVLNTDNVSGAGTVKAQGSPEIIINNNTNLYTKINDLAIEDYGGEVIYNHVSLGDAASSKLSTLSYVETNDSSDALISVNQNWSGTVQVKDDNNVVQNLTPLTTLEINGNLANPLGRVEISNLKGDITIQGKTVHESASITGREVILSASSGSISQGYTEGIVNIGATPEDLYSDYATTQENAIDGHETSTTTKKTTKNDIDESLQSGSLIAGGSVFINASDINLNGLVQSGYSEYSLTLSAVAQNSINNFDLNYNGENITSDILTSKYKINSGGAKYNGGLYSYEVQAYYNPQTKQIILEDIDPNGGKVYLTGRISSTGNGRIISADGSANVSVNNLTNREVVFGKVNVGDIDGLIKLTDTAKDLVTEFKRGATTTYAIGSEDKTVSGASGFYSPKTGLYYNWSDGYQESDWEQYFKKKSFAFWGGYTYNSNTIKDHENSSTRIGSNSGSSDLIPGTYIGEVSGAAGEYTIFYKNDVGYHETWYKKWVDYDDWTHFTGYEKYKWGEKTGKVVTFQHSLNAYNPVSISFIGSTSGGSINLDSAQNIQLGGDVKGVSGTSITMHSDGSINQLSGLLTGDNVSLIADQGIGNDSAINHKAISDNAVFYSRTENGDIGINSFASIGKEGNIALTAIANNGNTQVSTDGSIIQVGLNTSVKGERIDLESRHGSIGEFGNSLIIKGGQWASTSADTMSASVNAKANSHIYLTQTSGNMRLGIIDASNGNVGLRVTNGSFHNVLPASVDSADGKSDGLIARWVELGIINADGSNNETQTKNAAILNFENAVRSEFNNYVSQKNAYEDNPELVKSDTYLDLDSKYSAFADADTYLSVQYANTESDYYKISNDTYGWSKDQLLYAIQSSIINQTSGSSQTLERPANIQGENITLTSLGGIGKDEASEEISLVNIGSNLDALKKLARAEASDVIWDEAANKATITHTTPIGIKMTDANGSLNATANWNIYIAATTNDPIYVNNIDASNKNIRVLGRDGVFNVSSIPNFVNFKGADLIIEGGTGSIGAAEKPIVTQVSGKFTARAEGLINVFQNSLNAMNISAIYGGYDVTLRSLGDLFSVNTGIQAEDLGYVNAAGNLRLISDTGSIGETGKGLRILVDNTDLIEVTALLGDISLEGQVESTSGSAFTAGKLTAGPTGKVAINNAGSDINLTDIVSGVVGVSLTGKTVSQTTPLGYILTAALTALTSDGVTFDHDNNQILQAQITNTSSGDIIFETPTAIILNEINNSATDGKVVISSPLAIGSVQNITALGDIDINAGTSINAIAQISSNGNLNLTSNSGNVIFNNFDISGNMNVAAPGEIAFNSGVVDGNVTAAGNSITVVKVLSDGNINFDASNGPISAGTLLAEQNLTLDSENSNVAVANAQSNNTSICANNGHAVIGSTKTENDTQISAKGIEIVRGNAGNNLELTATEDQIIVGSLDAGNNVALSSSSGAVVAGQLKAGNDLTVNAYGDVTAVTSTAGHDLNIDSATGFVKTMVVFAENELNLTADGKIENLLAGAGNSMNMVSRNGDLETVIANAFTEMNLRAENGNLIAGSLIAGDNISLIADTIDVLSAISLGDVNISVGGDYANLVNVEAGQDLNLNADNGSVMSGVLIAANDVVATAKDMTIGVVVGAGIHTDEMYPASINDSISELFIYDPDFSSKMETINDPDFSNKMEAINDPEFNGKIQALAETTMATAFSEFDMNPVFTYFTNLDAPPTLNEALSSTIDTAMTGIFSGNIYDPDLAQSILNGEIHGDGVFSVTALSGDLDIGNAMAAGSLDLSADNGTLSVIALEAGKDVSASAYSINLASTNASRDVNLTAVDLINDINVFAGNDIKVSSDGNIERVNTVAGNNTLIVSNSGNIESMNAESGNNIDLSAYGSVNTDVITSGNNITISASSINSNLADAGQNISFAGANIDSELADAGQNISFNAANIDSDLVNAGQNISFAGANIDSDLANAGQNLNMTATSKLTSNNAQAGSSISMSADETINSVDAQAKNGDLSLAATNIVSNIADAGKNLNMVATNDLTTKKSSAGLDLSFTAAGSIVAETNVAGSNLSMNANSINLNSAQADQDLSLEAEGSISATTLNAGNDIAISNVNNNIQVSDAVAEGNLSINTTAGNIKLTRATATKGNAVLKAHTGSITIADKLISGGSSNVEAEGSISATTLNAGYNIDVYSANADILIERMSSGHDLSLGVSNGEIEVNTLTAGSDAFVNNKNGSIGIQKAEAGNNLEISGRNGNINLTDAIGGKELIVRVESGHINIENASSRAGNILFDMNNGSFTVSNAFEIGGDSLVLINKGDFLLDALNIVKGISIINSAGNLTIGELFSRDGSISIEAKETGNIELAGVTAKNDLDLRTDSGNIFSEGSFESIEGSVNLVAGGNGNIDVHELLARKDAKGLAENGDIMLAKINGKNVTLTVNHEGGRVKVDQANVGESVSVSADKIAMDTVNHTEKQKHLKMFFSGYDEGPMDNLVIRQILSETGVQLKGLWANTAEIHTEADYFRLENVYIIDKGHVSNKSFTLGVYGRNPQLDGSDIIIYFAPTGGQSFTNISFQNEFSNGGQDYVLFYRDDDIKTNLGEMSQMEKIAAIMKNDEYSLKGSDFSNLFLKLRPVGFQETIAVPADIPVAFDGLDNFVQTLSLQNDQTIYLTKEESSNQLEKEGSEEINDFE